MEEQKTKELVQRMKRSEQTAYEEVYRETYRSVYFICLGFLKNEENAKDAMQDTYMTAFSKLEQLKEEEKFVAWLKQIAVNRCKRLLEQPGPELMDAKDLENMKKEENENFLPEDYITNKAKRKIVMDIMRKKLSDIQYQTVILFYFNDLEIEEIADMMECPPGTVKSRLSVARNKIKEGVLEYEKENRDKVYSFVGIPFLTSLLTAEASGMEVPDIWEKLELSLKKLKKVGEVDVNNDDASRNSSMQTKGESKMSKSIKSGSGITKSKMIVAAIVAIALIGVGIGIAIEITKGNANETVTENMESIEKPEDIQFEASEETDLTEVEIAENPAYYLNYNYDMFGESTSDEDLNIVFFDDGINKITSDVTVEDLYTFIVDDSQDNQIDNWENIKDEYMTLDVYLDEEAGSDSRYFCTWYLNLYSTTKIDNNGNNRRIGELKIHNLFLDGEEHTARECLEAGYWDLYISDTVESVPEGYDTLPDYLFVNAGTPDYISNLGTHPEPEEIPKRFISYLTKEYTEDTTKYYQEYYHAGWISDNNVVECFITEELLKKERLISYTVHVYEKDYMEYMITNREKVSSYSGQPTWFHYQLFLNECGLK